MCKLNTPEHAAAGLGVESNHLAMLGVPASHLTIGERPVLLAQPCVESIIASMARNRIADTDLVRLQQRWRWIAEEFHAYAWTGSRRG